jgi:hypothetical protein
MPSEAARIADQLRRAFGGEAWHGPSLRELLNRVTVQQAANRPLPAAHTIWELVLHIDQWVDAAYAATQGVALPNELNTEKDWPSVGTVSAAAWTGATSQLFRNAERLSQAIEGCHDKLEDTVPGRHYDFYYLLHGVVQHSLYHAGQIAILCRAAWK